ncbi:MAG: cysteine desulfurase [Ruminococcus sp.]|jgi:cysteine desulfurase|nr:cysteine desulfurase [Ruminococcus sp.]
MIYLDNASTTRPCEAAVKAVMRTLTDDWGNPSSLHKAGLAAELLTVDARRNIAGALTAAPECIYFTSGATEANNTLIRGMWECSFKRRRKIVISDAEHPSVEEPVRFLEENCGAEVIRISPAKNGIFDADDFIMACDENTAFISAMLINNETGTILPIKKIFTAVKKLYPDIITHTDAVQGFLKHKFKAADLAADCLTISGHKIHAVKGAGVMYIKKGLSLKPLMQGGGQERGMRPGTESVPAIYAFGEAVKALKPTVETALSNAQLLNKNFRKKLQTLDFITINSPEEASPYIINFSVKNIRSEIMLHFLEAKEICVSSGSACATGSNKSNKPLTKLGVSPKNADEALRISLSRTTVPGDLEVLISALKEGYQNLQKKG